MREGCEPSPWTDISKHTGSPSEAHLPHHLSHPCHHFLHHHPQHLFLILVRSWVGRISWTGTWWAGCINKIWHCLDLEILSQECCVTATSYSTLTKAFLQSHRCLLPLSHLPFRRLVLLRLRPWSQTWKEKCDCAVIVKFVFKNDTY